MPSQLISEFQEMVPPLPGRLPLAELPGAQEAMVAYCVAQWPALSDVEQENVVCDGVAAIWHRPPNPKKGRVVLYVHGGGYVWCSAESHAGIISRVASESQSETIALDYAVAPSKTFPGPVEEGVTLSNWLLTSGHAPEDIAIVGDSAGGGLVLALVHALKSRLIPLPACAAVSSAYTDLTNSGESIDWVTSDRCVSREGLDFCVELYLGGHDPRDPMASPLHGDLSGFPPLLLQVGSRERLLSDSTRFAAKADAAGVDVKLEVYDGCMHLWQWWVPEAPEAKAAVSSIASFIATHTR